MRHGDKINNLGRKNGHRKALLKNLANALIQHKRIKTTLAKAKVLRGFIEPLVTKSRNNTTHSRRTVFSYLQNKEAAKELFDVIAPAVGDRPGGYVRVIRMGFRKGDAAEMALIEFVDFNTDYSLTKKDGEGKKKKTRRGGGGAKKSVEPTNADAPKETEPVEDVMEKVDPVEDVMEDKPADDATEK